MMSGEYIVAQNAHAALEAARENLMPVIVEAEERYTG